MYLHSRKEAESISATAQAGDMTKRFNRRRLEIGGGDDARACSAQLVQFSMSTGAAGTGAGSSARDPHG
jgi:hypothetical protein